MTAYISKQVECNTRTIGRSVSGTDFSLEGLNKPVQYYGQNIKFQATI